MSENQKLIRIEDDLRRLVIHTDNVENVIFGYVNIIASSLVLDATLGFVIPYEQVLCAFVNDPIAKRLMETIIGMWIKGDTVKVFAPIPVLNYEGQQSLCDMVNIIRKYPTVSIIAEDKSQFVATVHRATEKEIYVELWYLPICIRHF